MTKIYSKTQTFCGQCNATYRAMDAKGIEYEVLSLEDQPIELIEQWKAQGLLSAPIVFHDEKVWSGFRPDIISTI